MIISKRLQDDEAIRLAEQDMAAVNREPMRSHPDGHGRDQDLCLEQASDGTWSWYGYGSESHGHKTKADAARAYIEEQGLL